MRLTLKFGTVFLLGLTAVLAAYAWATLQRETRLFRADMARDNVLTGQILAVAIRELGDGAMDADIRALLARAAQIESPVRLRWIPDEAGEVEFTSAQRALLRRGERVVGTRSTDRRGQGELLTYVPVRAGSRLGAIEVAEPLREVERYTRQTLQRIAVATAAAIAVCGALFAILGSRLIGRPVNQLVDGFTRVARGDLDHPPIVPQTDELGKLSREFGILCRRLAEARRLAGLETERRLAALEQLRHADRLRTVGQLTAGVAHELGTPLNVVWARASMIARGEAAGDEITHCARIIEEQSQRMTSIIRKLLEFARPRPPARALTDLAQLVDKTFEVLAATARKHGVRLAAETAAVDARLNVDPGQIQQVLSNLVLNAIQAMPNGGEVQVRIDRRRAAPPAGRGGPLCSCLCLTVEDQGEGIKEADLPRLFEPFFTTKQVGVGTGLGLSISQGIVGEHGGWIEVSSAPGAGARFTVFLPEEAVTCAVAS